MYVEKTSFGMTKEKKKITQITMNNDNHISVSVINFGATLTSLRAPDSSGHVDNITLGFNKLIDYEEEHPYLGATVGRFANRIAKGRFKLGRRVIKLDVNNGPNHLHGGLKGFDKKVWDFKTSEGRDACSVTMSCLSEDGDEGYPGNLKVEVKFTLTNENELKIDYFATTDKTTVINLTNHAYWNLKGAGTGKVHDHSIYINADRYLPIDETSIPTGELATVHNTPFYFLDERKIGEEIDKVNGYDHCYVLNHDEDSPGELHACTVFDSENGRRMEVFTDQPGVQFYTGNYLSKVQTINGEVNEQEAFCLETQNFPDSVNRKEFPSPVLKPGEEYKTSTVYKFSFEPRNS